MRHYDVFFHPYTVYPLETMMQPNELPPLALLKTDRYTISFTSPLDQAALADICALDQPHSGTPNFENPDENFIKAVKDNEIVGVLGFEISDNTAEITHLHAKYKRAGVATALADALFCFANTMQVTRVKADATPAEVAFYDHLGFEIDGLSVRKNVKEYVDNRHKYVA